MNRTEAINAMIAALAALGEPQEDGTGGYSFIEKGWPDALNGTSPAAVVYGQGGVLEYQMRARDNYLSQVGVIVLVQRPKGDPGAAEDMLAAKVRQVTTIMRGFKFYDIRSDRLNNGRIIDGSSYIGERVIGSVDESTPVPAPAP